MNSEQTIEVANCTDLRQIVPTQPPGLVHCLAFLLILLVLAALTFAAVTKADLVVRAGGRVRPTTEPVKIFSGEKFSPDMGARIVEVNFRNGDQVRQGDILIRLDTQHLDNQMAKLRRTIEAGQQELAKLKRLEELQNRESETARAKARAEFEQAREESTLADKRRLSDIRLATLELENAKDESNRLDRVQMRLSHAVTDRKSIESKIRVQEATQKLGAATLPLEKGKLRVLRQAIILSEQRQEVRREELELEREVKLGEVEAAEMDLRNLQLGREQAVIRSSTDGIVISQEPTVGDVIQSGKPVVEIADQDGFHFHLAVSNEDVGHLRVGMPTRIKLDAYDYQKYGIIEGTVVFVAPDSQVPKEGKAQTRSAIYVVKIGLDQHEVGAARHRAEVKLGMTGEADIVTGQERLYSLLVRGIRRTISLN